MSSYGRLIFWIVISLFLAGCGGKSSDKAVKAEGGKHEEHAKEGEGGKHEEQEGDKEGVAFKEGRGLTLNPDIVRALALKTVEAEDRALSAEMKLLGQVFTTSPQILASASVPETEAERLEKQTFTGAKLVRVDRASATATKRVEAIFAIERTPAPQVGDFVELVLASEPRTVLSVPRSAVLEGAMGNFVYVVNGENYLRTPVKIGVRSRDFVEIADGLYAGDVVVTTPVNQLWLAELRLTKGGGHSH